MSLTQVVSEEPTRHGSRYTSAEVLELCSTADDDVLERCFDAIRIRLERAENDDLAFRRELRLLNGWLKEHRSDSAFSASSDSLALHIGTMIREGAKIEDVARRIKFMRCFYACLKQLDARSDDPMSAIRVYAMFEGASYRY